MTIGVAAWIARRFALTASLLSAAFAGTASSQIPSALRLEPRGVYATGTTSTFKVVDPSSGHNEYHFKYVGGSGDDTIEYVVDVDDDDVLKGMMKVSEKTTGAAPITKGGFSWRTAAGLGTGSYDSPQAHALQADVLLYHENLDPNTKVLTLKYKESRYSSPPPPFTTVDARKSYEFWIVGKVLKIHAYADGSVNDRYIDNYDFFHPGVATFVIGRQEQQIPYMDNTPVVAFAPTTHLPAPTTFYSISDDYFASHGVMGDWSLVPATQGADSWEHWYPLDSLRNSSSQAAPYQILAIPDETLNLIVTSKIEETFTVIPNYRSPYYALTAGRMMFFCTSQEPGSWDRYRTQYDAFKSWGLTDVAIIQYMSRRLGSATVLSPLDPDESTAGIMGCLPQNIVHGSLPVSGYYPVDPFDATNVATVATEFGALKDSARSLGALFATTDTESGLDQWGTNEVKPPGIAPNPDYPITRPLHFRGWTVPGYVSGQMIDVGLDCRNVSTAFNSAWVVRDEDGLLYKNFDNGYILNGSSWTGSGYCVGTVDARYIYDLVTAQVKYGRDHYRANAVNYDASAQMPDYLMVDRTWENPQNPPTKTHATGDYLKLRTKADRDIRKYVGGPMYGEPNHWRWSQGYDYGARDGFRDAFPLDDGSGAYGKNAMSWVLPDYDLREVLPKAAGNCGMGKIEQHMNGVGTPVDGEDGNSIEYLDSYITTSATYGHNGFTENNGWVFNNYITDEGILRQYAYLGGLSRRMHEGRLVRTTYYGAGANPPTYDLSHAIAAGIDLKNPRIKLEFDNGLVLYANHDMNNPTPWTLPQLLPILDTGNFETLTLSNNGFAAADGWQIFVFFNGYPANSHPIPFDYVKYANQWEAITNRGANSTNLQQYTGRVYNGFPSAGVTGSFTGPDIDLFSEATIFFDARLNVAVGAHGGLWDQNFNSWHATDPDDGVSKVAIGFVGHPPTVHSFTLSSNVTALYTNKPEGVVARLNFDGGTWQDVTTLASWSATNATIDQSGAVTATNPGTSTVTATYTPPGGSLWTANLNFTALDGRPSADAGPDLTVYPGTAVGFDASSSADPKQGPVRCDWDFGDGSVATGAKVDHVYTESPGVTRTVMLTVRDVEDNLRTDTASVTVKLNNDSAWWDNFDDGVLDRYSQLAGDVWGVRAGLAQQLLPDANYHELTIAGSNHLYGNCSTGVEFKMIDPTQSNYAGLHVRKAHEDDTPGAPADIGYKAVVAANGNVTLAEGGSGGISQSATIPGFVASARHDVRIVEKRVTSTRVRVYVDGVKRIEATDTSPPASGYAGLVTFNQKCQFDDLRITDASAPYVTATPLEYASSAYASFFIDDQESFTHFRLTDATSMVFTIKAEDGPAAGQSRVYNGWSGAASIATVATTPTLVYENGSALNSTWARVTMAQSIDTTMNTFNAATKTISYEMVVHDDSSPSKFTRKYVRYTRP